MVRMLNQTALYAMMVQYLTDASTPSLPRPCPRHLYKITRDRRQNRHPALELPNMRRQEGQVCT
jgi:hypothetical protein